MILKHFEIVCGTAERIQEIYEKACLPENVRGTDIPPFSEQSRGYFHPYKFVKKNCR